MLLFKECPIPLEGNFEISVHPECMLLFLNIEWTISPGNMTKTWMTSIDSMLTKDLNR